MIAISPTFLPTIERFATSMDLRVELSRDGSVSFDFENSGRVSFTQVEDGVLLMSLTRPRPLASPDAFLRLAGFDPAEDRIVHVGMTKTEKPVAWTRFSPQGFELSDLERALKRLITQFPGA